jgi:glyoxylase-like metal-dependent hydrolase (beta-lactamase superfamily II)
MNEITDFHSFRHGNFDVTIMSDGPIELSGEIFAPEANPEERAAVVQRLGGAHNLAHAQSNIPLIVSGEEIVLIDVGAGTRFQPSEGQLETNLGKVGVDTKDITTVILSHAHPDHIWGVTHDDGSLRFDNARYVIGRTEWEFWTGPQANALPAEMQPFVEGARRELEAISGRVSLIDDGDEVIPGLHAIATPGHTPGHMSFILDGDRPLIVTVDAIANEFVAFERPDWSFGFDMDRQVARETRKLLLQRAADRDAKLLGFHWAYPGVGRIMKDGETYRFKPVSEAVS